MATPEQFDLTEEQFDRLILVSIESGLNSWELLDILLRKCVDLHLRASCEYRVKGGR